LLAVAQADKLFALSFVVLLNQFIDLSTHSMTFVALSSADIFILAS
jgi:hypothetical protein